MPIQSYKNPKIIINDREVLIKRRKPNNAYGSYDMIEVANVLKEYCINRELTLIHVHFSTFHVLFVICFGIGV